MSRNQAVALRKGDPVFILTLTGFAGESLRLATQPINVTHADGSVSSYSAGLSVPTFSERIERSGGNPEGNSIPMSIDTGCDLAALRARGHRLEQATAELAMVTVAREAQGSRAPTAAQNFEDRFRVHKGRPMSPSICPAGQSKTLAAFTLRSEVDTDTATILDPTARITASSWPSARDSALGEVYPLVFGNPGAYLTAAGSSVTTSGSPGFVVADSGGNAQKIFLTVGHASSSTVVIFDSSGNNDTISVTNGTDSEGRACAYADVSASVALSLTDSTFYVGWHASGGSGGLINPFGSGSVSRAGDLATYIASLSSHGIDRAAWGEVWAALNKYRLSGYINDAAVSPSVWLAKNLGKLLPMEVHGGPDGMRPVFYDPVYPISLAPLLTANADIVRVSDITQRGSPTDVRNRVTVDYVQRNNGGRFRRSLTLGPGEFSSDHHTTTMIEQSLTDYGRIIDHQIRADLVYEDATAERIAAAMIRAYAVLRDSVVYRVPAYMAGLTVGRLIRLTDGDVSITAAPALIVERRWTGEDWRITLELLGDRVLSPFYASA